MNSTFMRVLRWIGKGLMYTVVSVCGLVAVALLLLQTPWAQNRLAGLLSEQLNKTVHGRIDVSFGGSVSPFGLSGLSARVLTSDPAQDAQPLGVISNVRVDWNLAALVGSLTGEGPLTISVDSLAIETLTVDLRSSADGQLELAEALTPVPSEPTPTSEEGPAPLVRVDSFDVGEIRILLPSEGAGEARREAVLERVNVNMLYLESLRVTASLPSVSIPIPGQPTRFQGNLDAWLFMSNDGVPTARANLTGAVQELGLKVRANYHAERWTADTEVAGSAADWKSAELGWAPESQVNVSVSASGDLESADAQAKVQADSSVVTLDTQVEFSPVRAKGSVKGQQVQPALFAAGAPVGDINFDADFSVQAEPLRATTTLRVRASSLGERQVPDLDLNAQLTGATNVSFQLQTHDTSKLTLTGDLSTTASGLSFAVRGEASRLPEAASVSSLPLIRIRNLDLEGKGKWHGETASLDASLRLAADQVRAPTLGLHVSKLAAEIDTAGPIKSPELDGLVTINEFAYGDTRLSQLRLQANSTDGTSSSIQASTSVRLGKGSPKRRLDLRADLASFTPVDARDIELRLAGGKRTMTATVVRLEVDDGVSVDGLRVAGVGELEGSLKMAGNAVDADVVVEQLELEALSELLTPFLPELTGTVSAAVAVEMKGKHLASGHLYAQATDVGLQSSPIDKFTTSLVLRDDKLSGAAEVQRARSLLRVDTRGLDLAALADVSSGTWKPRDLRGYAVFTANAHLVDFPELEQALGDLHAEGFLRASIAVNQQDNAPLTVSSILRLSDIQLRQLPSPKTDDPVAADEATAMLVDDRGVTQAAPSGDGWSVQQLTADWASRYDGSSGSWSNSLLVRSASSAQPIVGASFATRVALKDLVNLRPELINALPISGSVTIPLTRLAALPVSSFIPTGLEAELGGEVTVTGTVSSPSAVASLQVNDLRVASLEQSFPISVRLQAQASKHAIDATAEVSHEGSSIANASVKGAPETNDWQVLASIDEMPLGCFPFLRDYGIAGSLSGELDMQSGNDAPKLTAKLTATDVEAYGQEMPLLSLTAGLENGTGKVKADLRQSTGRVQVDLLAASPSRELADYRPTKLEVTANAFQIRPLMVAVRGSVSDLSGLLDGSARVDFQAEATEAQGELRISEGLVLLPALGKQVRDVEITAVARPGQLEITRIEADIERGHMSGKGKVQYAPGGRFLAEAELTLPDDEPLPISNKGRNIAEATGRIKVTASSDGPDDEIEVAVTVPELDVYFDALGADTVLATESPDFVSMGYYAPDGHFVSYDRRVETTDTTGKPATITVNLGDDVWIHQGTSTFAAVRGEVTAEFGTDVRVTGVLNLSEGRIDIQGRVFDIRPGTVSFRGLSPPNPDVVAEAAFSAPSGHTIIAGYRGSVQSGEVTLRSEPPLSYGEILNVLLFGDPQGQGDDSQGSPGGASAVAASVASAGLSQSLTSLTNLDIQANIETTVDGSPRPELGVRLSPRLAVEVAYNMQPVTSLSEPPDNAFVSFDWRLSSSWSLESRFGDKGSAAADISWKYRY